MATRLRARDGPRAICDFSALLRISRPFACETIATSVGISGYADFEKRVALRPALPEIHHTLGGRGHQLGEIDARGLDIGGRWHAVRPKPQQDQRAYRRPFQPD